MCVHVCIHNRDSIVYYIHVRVFIQVLLRAVYTGDKAEVEHLLSKGANPNAFPMVHIYA